MDFGCDDFVFVHIAESLSCGNVAELVDAVDSKSTGCKTLRVRFSPFLPSYFNKFLWTVRAAVGRVFLYGW